MTQGDYLTLSTAQVEALAASTAQVEALAAQLTGPSESPLAGGPAGIPQWVQLANGRWISEKDPGYPFLAAPFPALGIIRLAPRSSAPWPAWACTPGAGGGSAGGAARRRSGCSAPPARRCCSPGVTTCRRSPTRR
jgi:hypothetical protein